MPSGRTEIASLASRPQAGACAVEFRADEAFHQVGADANHNTHVTSAYLIDELCAACQITQSAQRLVAQGGSFQCVDVGYAVLYRSVGSPNVARKDCPAQFCGWPRRYEVRYRLGLEAHGPWSAVALRCSS